MASRNDDQGAEALGMAIAALFAMIAIGSFAMVKNSVTINNRLKDPDHPKRRLRGIIFSTPVIIMCIGLFIMVGGEPGMGFSVIFWTAVGYLALTAYLVSSPTALGPEISPSAIQLESYLYPFDQEPPEDRSEFPGRDHTLSRGERFEQTLSGQSLPARGPKRKRARELTARVLAARRAMRRD